MKQPVIVDVVIVGGSVSGLAAACALRLAGASVVVIEKRSDMGDANRGDVLKPRAAQLLQSWNVSYDRSMPLQEMVVQTGARVLVRRSLGEHPGRIVAHTQLELGLREAARRLGADLRMAWSLQHVMQDGGRVRGLTAVSLSDGAEFRAKLIIGADGRSSALREAVGLRVKWDEKGHELIAAEAEIPAGTPNFDEKLIQTEVGPDGGGILVPMGPRRARVRVIAAPGEADSLTRLPPDEFAQKFIRRTPLPFGSKIDPSRVRTYEHTASGHALNYARPGAVLIGDAAHVAPIPSMEALQMAILDVECLVRFLAPALGGGEKAIDKAVDRYQLERWPDNERRLLRARSCISWLHPLSGAKGMWVKTPLATPILSSLLAID